MNDLTEAEQDRARVALRFLWTRCGNLENLAKVLRYRPVSIRHIVDRRDSVSTTMVLRIARTAGVTFDDVVCGRYPVEGACPHCGQVPPLPPRIVPP